MDKQDFWGLIDQARAAVPDPADDTAVAETATALLSARPPEEIIAAQQALWELMADSYRTLLWAAAYVINGGCSDDGFDYFRGWLILQGREVFERAVTDPDSLADLPAVQAASEDHEELEHEETLAIAWNAHRAATGENLPQGSFSIRYPALEPMWDFEEERTESQRRLPRLHRLYERHYA